MKKLTALLLALTMLVCTFAGCGQKDEPEPDDAPKEGTDADEPEPEPEDELVITDTFYPVYNTEKEYKEMRKTVSDWFDECLKTDSLFSVKIGGTAYSELKARLTKNVTEGTDADGNRTVKVVYTDPDTSLEFTVDAILWKDYPAVDITAYAENKGTDKSPRVAEFYTVDTSFPLAADRGYALHTTIGSDAQANDFEPVEKNIIKGTELQTFSADLGKSSSTGAWPYFDVIGKNEGIVLSVGWSGCWEASFGNKDLGQVNFKTRQKHLDAVLAAGEKIRTPKAVLLYFQGDAEYGHNVQRKMIVEHYTPDDGTENRFVAPICVNLWGGRTMKSLINTVKLYSEAEIPVDAFWVDAGWYGDYPSKGDNVQVANGEGDDRWSVQAGNWTANKNLFGKASMKEFADAVHASGSKFLLWMMFENAKNELGSKLTLGKDSLYPSTASSKSWDTLRLDREDIYEKSLALIEDKIENEGMDWLRIDYGANPTEAWLNNDKEDADASFNKIDNTVRNGITENKYITNLYRIFDTISAKYPGFRLDNCAGGGRRLDIELVSRSFAVWRTDANTKDLESMQAQTQWISYWLPFTSVGVVGGQNYATRSFLAASVSLASWGLSESDMPRIKAIYEEYAAMRPYFYGSYYQLAPATCNKTDMQAYEYLREDWQKGIALVIRRPESVIETYKLKYKGLVADRTYLFHDVDDAERKNDFKITGDELMNKGVNVALGAVEAKIFEVSIVME